MNIQDEKWNLKTETSWRQRAAYFMIDNSEFKLT